MADVQHDNDLVAERRRGLIPYLALFLMIAFSCVITYIAFYIPTKQYNDDSYNTHCNITEYSITSNKNCYHVFITVVYINKNQSNDVGYITKNLCKDKSFVDSYLANEFPINRTLNCFINGDDIFFNLTNIELYFSIYGIIIPIAIFFFFLCIIGIVGEIINRLFKVPVYYNNKQEVVLDVVPNNNSDP